MSTTGHYRKTNSWSGYNGSVIPYPPTLLVYLLAALPILILLGLMIRLRWGAHQAGPASWALGIIIAALFFGLTPEVLVVSQARGVLLTIYVLMVMWPALLLYNIVDKAGGIRAIAGGLEHAIADRGLLLVLLAWAFSTLLGVWRALGCRLRSSHPCW
jgi:lactate permease